MTAVVMGHLSNCLSVISVETEALPQKRPGSTQQFADLLAEADHLEQGGRGEAFDLLVPRGHGLEEVEELADALAGVLVLGTGLLGVDDALAEDAEGRVDLAALALVHDLAVQLPDVLDR